MSVVFDNVVVTVFNNVVVDQSKNEADLKCVSGVQ